MDNEVRDSGNVDVRSSYWLDACEDDYFLHLGASTTLVPESCSQDGSHEPCFFDGSEPSKKRRVWDNRTSGRKRHRGSDDTEMDVRGRDQVRRRERYNSCSWKDREFREAKGFWERDKATNELIFQVGSWESCRNKKEKLNNVKINKGDEELEEKKVEELKEKLPEEQARQYQLDVLEQAKSRNTIAFLETGAGKTLIAVLLIKSISLELQKQNKKMLAVFLVPKVPLVYQVVIYWTTSDAFFLFQFVNPIQLLYSLIAASGSNP